MVSIVAECFAGSPDCIPDVTLLNIVVARTIDSACICCTRKNIRIARIKRIKFLPFLDSSKTDVDVAMVLPLRMSRA
jgi:hypothetical protein